MCLCRQYVAKIYLALYSGGFRKGLPRPLPVTLEVRTEYLEATLGLVKSGLEPAILDWYGH